MQREHVTQLLSGQQEELRRLGVQSLALFGSVVRGTQRPDSDIDILVEFEGRATFDRYMELKFFLEELLGAPVDLVTHKALRPSLRPSIEREAIYVA